MKKVYERLVKKVVGAMLLVCFAMSSMATVYYVSNSGNDANTGLSTSLPWKTLAKVNATAFKAGDQVLFQKGNAFYGTLTINNSGTSGTPITIGAYGTGANPIITGFTAITSGWTNEGGGIYSKVISSESQTNMVTIDGVQYGMGRYPNTTFLTYESASGYVSITDNELTGTPNWTGAEAVIYKNGYRYERDLITSHSGGTLNYTIVSGSNMNASAPNKYFIQNDLRTLDSYGEWYHDFSGTGKLYLYFGAVDPTTKTVKVATLNNLCKVNTTKTYITLDGLALSGSIKEAFTAQYNCHYLTIQNSNVSFAGSDGIYIDGQFATINNSTFNYCNRISLMTKGVNSTITNNSISNNAVILGQSFGWSGTSAIVLTNTNATVTGNNVENTGTNGIFLSADVDAGLVKNNYIYNTCIHNWDHGSIYTFGDHTDLVIEGNVIIKSDGAGIYLDEVSSFNTVKNNSVSGCNISGIKLHKAHNCTVTGNTSYNNNTGVQFLNWENANNIHDIVLSGNTIVSKLASQKVLNYSTIFTGHLSTWASNTFNSNIYARPIDDNLTFFYNQIGSGNLTLSQWKSNTGIDGNSTASLISISSESDMQFMYNTSTIPTTVNLSKPMIDMKGVKYPSSITLQPYTSVVLLKDSNPAKYSTEYKSICNGSSYNGWTVAGKYERTLTAKTGGDSIVTTFLTVNPIYAVSESITINAGETYNGWSTSGTYTRTLSTQLGCDSVVTTNLTVESLKSSSINATQTIILKKGYNMISTYVTATDPAVSVVTQPIVESGSLIKIQDEAGNSYENWGSFGGWVNNLGTIQPTEGYKIKVAEDCTLQINGLTVALPLDIPLNAGWNIISFPRTDALDAMTIIQPLISQNKLIKVQDEAGNSIEDWGVYGGWKNGIGNFVPGKAYRVKLSASAVLTIQESYPKSALLLTYAEKTSYFTPDTEGNGVDHMNINLVGLREAGFVAGDELAAFDGDVCVGTLKISDLQLNQGSASLVTSALTGAASKDGFKEGSTLQVYHWKQQSGAESQVALKALKGSLTFQKSASILVQPKSLTTTVSSFANDVRIDVYPNPTQGRFTVRFSSFPEAGSRIDVLDLSGRKVASSVVNGLSEEINLAGQAAGMYLVKSVMGATEKIQKLVLQ